MLWINVIIDSFASLALATEPPTDELLTRHPTRKTEKIITPYMWRSISVQGICQLVVLFTLIFYGDVLLGVPSSIGLGPGEWTYQNGVHFTFFFNTFVFLQLFNFLNARILKREELNPFVRLFNNWIFWFIIALTFFGQIAFVQLFGESVKCSPLTLRQHLISLAIGCLAFVFSFVSKIIPEALLPIPQFLKEREVVNRSNITNNFMSKTRGSLNKRSKTYLSIAKPI